jgi:hypothetical protein
MNNKKNIETNKKLDKKKTYNYELNNGNQCRL